MCEESFHNKHIFNRRSKPKEIEACQPSDADMFQYPLSLAMVTIWLISLPVLSSIKLPTESLNYIILVGDYIKTSISVL